MQVVAKIAAQHANAVDREARFPREAIDALREQGLLGIMVPIGLGGESATISDVAELCTILGRACSAASMVFAMHQIKMSSLVHHAGDANWLRAFMRRAASEQLLCGPVQPSAFLGVA